MKKLLLSLLFVGLFLAYTPDTFGCDPPRALRSYGCQGGAAAYNSYVAPQASPCPTCSTQPTVPFSAPQVQVQADPQITYAMPQVQVQAAPIQYVQSYGVQRSYGIQRSFAPGYCAPRQVFQSPANVIVNVRSFAPVPTGAFATAGRGVSSGFGGGAAFAPGPPGGGVAKSFSLTGPFGGGIRRTVVRQ